MVRKSLVKIYGALVGDNRIENVMDKELKLLLTLDKNDIENSKKTCIKIVGSIMTNEQRGLEIYDNLKSMMNCFNEDDGDKKFVDEINGVL